MMSIIGASKVITCNENNDIINDGGIVFEDKCIIEVGVFNDLIQKYKIQGNFFDECCITPALINAHTHIEFSSSFPYNLGSFSQWLSSIIAHRQEEMTKKECMYKVINLMQQNGIGTIGAISSQGFDLQPLVQSSLRVVYFNEIIGSSEENQNFIYKNFLQRIEDSLKYQSHRFSIGIAIHSPYSVIPSLITQAITQAQNNNFPLSVHFLESAEEREWLENSCGFFKEFYKKFNLQVTQSFHNINGFLQYFDNFNGKILFVHATHAREHELYRMAKKDSALVSCPVSNRLLGGRMLDFKKVNHILPCILATDSLASHYSLSLLEEMKIALFSFNAPLLSLAQELFLSVTQKAGQALGLNIGMLNAGMLADIAVFHVPFIKQSCNEILSLILQAKQAQNLWIDGVPIPIERYNYE